MSSAVTIEFVAFDAAAKPLQGPAEAGPSALVVFAGDDLALAAKTREVLGTSVSRYERAAKVAMEIAMKMSDELMRDAAVRDIVDLCLKANDMKTARILLRAIQAPSIRDMVLRDHPDLKS